MRIPYEKLSSAVLESIIEEFITREGTDYGTAEVSLEAKVKQVKDQLAKGKAVVVFNPEDETCSILTSAEANRMEKLQEELESAAGEPEGE